MNTHFKFGMTHSTAFVTKTESHATRFDRAVKQKLRNAYDRDRFFRLAYLNWMGSHAVHPYLPSEARWPILFARQQLATSTPLLYLSPGLETLQREIEHALDETVVLFGLDPENAYYAALKSSGGTFSFSSLISHIVLSELIPDETIHLANPSQWRHHWRGGRL